VRETHLDDELSGKLPPYRRIFPVPAASLKSFTDNPFSAPLFEQLRCIDLTHPHRHHLTNSPQPSIRSSLNCRSPRFRIDNTSDQPPADRTRPPPVNFG
jgi:hypothetical protein